MTRDELLSLRHKYELLRRLRAEPDATEPGPYAQRRRAGKGALAARFPGALRELDACDETELARRAADVERCLATLEAAAVTGSGVAEPPAELLPELHWVAWMADYHARWRRARAEGATTEGTRHGSRASVAQVLAAVGQRFGVSAAAVREVLFGGARKTVETDG